MTQSNLLRPAIAPSKGGLLIIGYDGSRVSVADSEVEQWIEDLKEVRKKQLIRDCRRIAGCSDLTDYVKSDLHPDHDIEITEHGLGVDLNQNGNTLHIDQSQYERIAEILRRQERYEATRRVLGVRA